MKIHNISIGEHYKGSGGIPYYCIDKGSRTAIMISTLLNFEDFFEYKEGLCKAPYVSKTEVFDDGDISVLEKKSSHIKLYRDDFHPGFSSDDLHTMFSYKTKLWKHKEYKEFKNLLEHERLGSNGHIYHPYYFEMENQIPNIIYVLDIFTKEHLKLNIDDFLSFPLPKRSDFSKLFKKFNHETSTI